MIRIKSKRSCQWPKRLGNKAPQGYQCFLPSKCKNPVIQRSIAYVLQQITEYCHEDAVELENNVAAVWPLPAKYHDHLGLWDPYPESSFYQAIEKGIIYVRDDGSLDSDQARWVFAHECAHAVDRKEYRTTWDESCVPARFYLEAAANKALIKWGMEDIFERVEKARGPQITWEGLKRIHQNLNSVCTYGQPDLEWSLTRGELEERLGIKD